MNIKIVTRAHSVQFWKQTLFANFDRGSRIWDRCHRGGMQSECLLILKVIFLGLLFRILILKAMAELNKNSLPFFFESNLLIAPWLKASLILFWKAGKKINQNYNRIICQRQWMEYPPSVLFWSPYWNIHSFAYDYFHLAFFNCMVVTFLVFAVCYDIVRKVCLATNLVFMSSWVVSYCSLK